MHSYPDYPQLIQAIQFNQATMNCVKNKIICNTNLGVRNWAHIIHIKKAHTYNCSITIPVLDIGDTIKIAYTYSGMQTSVGVKTFSTCNLHLLVVYTGECQYHNSTNNTKYGSTDNDSSCCHLTTIGEETEPTTIWKT